jgi:hypothetical protein
MLRKEQRLRIIENRVLRKSLNISGRMSEEGGENCVMRSLIICVSHEIIL